ncbi:MAG: phosphoglycerate kinase [Pseudomonadota bacterium]
MTGLPTLNANDLNGKTVLVRADLNAPMKDGVVTDATRLERFAPTAKELSETGAKVIILTHVGRPKGKHSPEFTAAPLAEALQGILGAPVTFVDDCIGDPVASAIANAAPGDILLAENLRFQPGEEKDDPEFASALAANGDIYINDAFSCAHRAHASTHAITKLLPSFAGPSLRSEVDALTLALDTPMRPVAALVGGAKVSTKIDVLTFLIPKMDTIIIGGGMANTFIAARGLNVGKSLYEADAVPQAKELMQQAGQSSCHLLLPDDVVVAKEFAANAENRTVGTDAIGSDEMALDVGAKTIAAIDTALESAKTLLWNGPLGAFEIEPFGTATFAVARKAAERTKSGDLVTVAGGGDTVAALNAANVGTDFTYVSTAGGAFLEWLEGKELPGIAALQEQGK